MKTPPDPPSSMERHSRKCAICTHPAREAIDQAFLHRSRCRAWADDSAQQTIKNIVKNHNLPSLSSLYRHAHATGLWLRRQKTDGAPNRESKQFETSNRENRPESGLLTAEIQRMLIGK
jgi:hypothetical protein